MGNSAEYRLAHQEEPAEYMRRYYRQHSTRPRLIPGTERESKRCRKCGTVKARQEFTVRQSGPRTGHLSAYCKPCSADLQRGRYQIKHKRDPTHYRRIEWPSKLKANYGITVDDYNRMLTAQGDACAICRSETPMSGSRGYKRRVRSVFDVDHCHKTGRVRGLLCTRCNRLVGLANDDVETAKRLVDYLSIGG